MYIPDVTSPEWLKRNYQDFQDKEQYVLSTFTFYKTSKAACRINQVGWGFSDGAHLDACIEIGYRVGQASVDATQKNGHSPHGCHDWPRWTDRASIDPTPNHYTNLG